jgi:hypothetical protein
VNHAVHSALGSVLSKDLFGTLFNNFSLLAYAEVF